MCQEFRFPRSIKAFRRRSGLLQRDVSERTGIARSKVSAYENGRKIPSGLSLDRLMDLYELSPSERDKLIQQWEVMLLIKPRAIIHMGQYRKEFEEIRADLKD